MSVDIGKMDRRVTIQSRTTAKDASNFSVITWGDRATVWARMIRKKGRDTDEGQQRVMSYPVEFVMRFRSDIEPTDRISYGGQYYQISSIEEMGRKEALRIMATAKDNYS